MGILFRENSKRSWLLLLIVCCIFLIGCDPVSHKKPFNFPNTKWACEELNVWFIVDPTFSIVYYGQMEKDGMVQEVGFYCGPSASGCINTFDSVADGILNSREAVSNMLWSGTVEYWQDKFVLTESDLNELFPEDAFPIEFIREDLTEEEIREISPWDADGNLKEGHKDNG